MDNAIAQGTVVLFESDLIELANRPDVKRITEFGKIARSLEIDDIAFAYKATKSIAPKRHDRSKAYFGTRNGVTESGTSSNRREEHLAVAMFNRSRTGNPFHLPDGRALDVIDYQTPLKAEQADNAIGKVDLLCLIDKTQKCIIELKVDGKFGARGDTPLRAVLEGLAYCAIVDANGAEINSEIHDRFGNVTSDSRPSLIVAAPSTYWDGYISIERAGDWRPAMAELASNIWSIVGVEILFVSLMDADFELGLQGQPPQLTGKCTFQRVPGL